MSLKVKLTVLFLAASFLPFAVVAALLYLNNPHILDTLLYFGALLIIFVIFLGLTLSGIFIEPINNLIRATRAVKSKDLSARVPVTSKDETGELAIAFNQMMDELEQSDTAKTEFVSLASHHLRTPLSAVRWQLESLLTERQGLNPEQAKHVEEAYRANLRMIELVNTLLGTSRLEIGSFSIKPELVNVSECVQNVLKDLQTKTNEHSLRVTTSINLKRKQVKIDPVILRVILQNLLDNALSYSTDAGTVNVTIESPDGNLLIKVKDSGYGIPQREQPQIFSKLYRASNIRQKETTGLGLGLYNVKTMVELAKGKIWFESQENHGSTFYVKLPLNSSKRVSGASIHD